MADPDRMREIMGKLYSKVALSKDEIAELQTGVDQLEGIGGAVAAEPQHHSSHSTPNSHHTNHHTKVTDIGGILETVIQKIQPGR